MYPTHTLNAIQAMVIRQLFFRERLRFAEINVEKISSDQFSYHLRQLVKYGIVQKHSDGSYSLTVTGRTRAVLLYPDQSTFVQQGFLAVRLVVTRYEADQQLVLMQRRLAVPYKDQLATPGDQVFFGEGVKEAAARALLEQTGLRGTITLRGLHHLKDVYQQDIVQDKYFFVCHITSPQGELLRQGRSGTNMWLPHAQVRGSPDVIHGCLELIDIGLGDQLQYLEKTYTVSDY